LHWEFGPAVAARARVGTMAAPPEGGDAFLRLKDENVQLKRNAHDLSDALKR